MTKYTAQRLILYSTREFKEKHVAALSQQTDVINSFDLITRSRFIIVGNCVLEFDADHIDSPNTRVTSILFNTVDLTTRMQLTRFLPIDSGQVVWVAPLDNFFVSKSLNMNRKEVSFQ